jgi:hypothetical protein
MALPPRQIGPFAGRPLLLFYRRCNNQTIIKQEVYDG